MDGQQITTEDLHKLALAMAQAIPDLDCPECCECGIVYQYIERSAELYREELEWACLAAMLMRYQTGKKQQANRAV